MVEPPVRVEGLGSSDSAIRIALYPASPVYSGELTDDKVIATFSNVVNLGGLVGTNTPRVAGDDGGHTFGLVDMDYLGAPDINGVVLGGAGLPSTPWSPNIIINPDDAHNPAGIPELDRELADKLKGGGGAFNTAPGTDAGANVAGANPKNTSLVIATQRIGSLRLGRGSTAG
jgi:hypothetical protein